MAMHMLGKANITHAGKEGDQRVEHARHGVRADGHIYPPSHILTRSPQRHKHGYDTTSPKRTPCRRDTDKARVDVDTFEYLE